MIQVRFAKDVPESEVLNRDIRADEDVGAAVDAILADVKREGDRALFRFAERFDRAKLTSLEVSAEEIDAAWKETDPDFRETLRKARDNIAAFHRQQLHDNFVIADRPGIVLGQRWTPIERAGVYVPGGTASYPSTVLMDIVPARIAGVSEICMITPPRPDGSVAPSILAAARAAGADRVFKSGGAGAIAAFAYGTETVPKVDKIVGPGNVFVATAKRKVFGLVDIDMIAGPSEILVIADGSCPASQIASDMLAQAEHDRMATAVLITDKTAYARLVLRQIKMQLRTLPRREIASASIETNGKILVTGSLEEAVALANRIAPEHLELAVASPFSLLPLVRNAGSVFLGCSAPEALGDYFAGPNHTLPTSGTARFSSPLGVDDFVKRSSFIYYSRDALRESAARIEDFARREGLEGHARSIASRFDGEEESK